MKSLLLAAALLLPAIPAMGQTPAPAPKLFISDADVQALLAKAKAEHKADNTNTVETLLASAPYRAALEYRSGTTPPSKHENQSEIIYIIQGGGTMQIGGTLVGGGRRQSNNQVGTAIDGGAPQKVGKGDYIFIPANTPHQFAKIDGELVIMSMHMPATAPK